MTYVLQPTSMAVTVVQCRCCATFVSVLVVTLATVWCPVIHGQGVFS